MNINELSVLVAETGFPVMMEAYEEQPLVYPQICEVVPHDHRFEFGEKSTVITGIGEFRERRAGQAYEADELMQGPSWYLRVRDLGRSLPLDGRLVRHANATRPGGIGNLIEKAAISAGRSARIASEKLVAGVLQKGTLTAGSLEYFNGTFVENNAVTADPYPKFIYDGLPFFDTAHPITVGSSTFSNHNPSLALNEPNYNSVRVIMESTNAVDERGQRVDIRPDTILVPPGQRKTALQIVETELQPGGANNDVNVSRGTAAVIPYPYLSDAASTGAWWVGQRGRGIRVRDSGDPQVRVIYDSERDMFKVIFNKYFGVTVVDWRFWYCANKAAA